MKSDHHLTRYHLILFQNPDTFLEREMVRVVQELLDDKVSTSKDQTEIDIWIESLGGDSHAAYKLILDLRSRCKSLNAVVPDYAKSAATLLLLGVDKIYMSPSAELGPLDVQIQHPDREDIIVSGLDIAQLFDFLIESAVSLAIAQGGEIRKYTGLTRQPVLHETLQFIAQFLEPTVTKLDASLIHQANQELKVAEDYARRLLQMRNVPKEQQFDSDKFKRLIEHMITHYHTHGFVISRTEARDFLQLPVEYAESYLRWEQVRDTHKTFIANNESMIDVIPDTELEQEISANSKAEKKEEPYDEPSKQNGNEQTTPRQTTPPKEKTAT